jgi:hypothetical protein
MFRNKIFAAVGLGAAAVLALGTGSAFAAPAVTPHSINATVFQTGPADGDTAMAGWYTNSFASLFTQVNGTFSLNTEAEGIGVSVVNGIDSVNNPTGTDPTSINGAIGIQLCNSVSGKADQLGAVYLGAGKFAVGYLHGTLTGSAIDPCVGGGVLGGASSSTTFTALSGALSLGDSVQAQIRQDGGGALYTAMIVGGVSNYTYFDHTGWIYPNEAGAGLQTDTSTLSAPAVNDLTDFSDVSAVNTDTSQQGGFDNWNAVEVVGSNDGVAPALITPTSLSDNAGPKVCHRVYHPHRYHHHHRRYQTVCTIPQDVSNNFSVDAGTPVGP